MDFAPCFYPTTVVFLDDDEYFFDELKYKLSLTRSLYQDFVCPYLFLEYLSKAPPNRFLQDYLTFVDYDLPDHYRHNANVVDFHQISHDPQRFEEISVVVLDYDMPLMNGLEVSQKITNPHIKKIMLTSIADEQIAIQAFHKGLIDAYIRKSDPSFLAQLNAHIYRLQKTYFAEVFTPFTQTLKTYHREVEQYPIFTKEYCHVLENFMHQHEIVEYYLCEGVGTCLLVNKQGQCFYFYCRNENDYQSLKWQVLSREEQTKLLSRKYLPHMHSSSWIKATKVEASIPFYYGWSKAESSLALESSFADYQSNKKRKSS